MPTSQPVPDSPVAAGVLEDLRRSPTPYHAVDLAADHLRRAGFADVDESAALPADPGRYFLVRGGSLVAWHQPETPPEGYLVVGAHTDSPNLRVRTRPDVTSAGVGQVGVEIYGGVLLNSWLDRDLGLAGRVSVEVDGVIETRLYSDDRPLLRIPQLAIHLDRDIRDQGLRLDPQRHMTPMWALDGAIADDGDGDEGAADGSVGPGAVRRHVAAGLGVEAEAILAWDLMAYDTQPPAVVGRDADLFASARIDNLVSAFAAVRALVALGDELGTNGAPRVPVVVLYDHEEIGSESATGASGQLLAATLERIGAAAGADRAEHLRALTASLVLSADGAHATHPNYVARHEPSHHIALNGGVVIKRNANQRYATDALGEAFVVAACNDADIPLQYYIHRNDLPCGSTIGPTTAARLGVSTVDVGAPQLAMHSIRELGGLTDLDHLYNMMLACWRRPRR